MRRLSTGAQCRLGQSIIGPDSDEMFFETIHDASKYHGLGVRGDVRRPSMNLEDLFYYGRSA